MAGSWACHEGAGVRLRETEGGLLGTWDCVCRRPFQGSLGRRIVAVEDVRDPGGLSVGNGHCTFRLTVTKQKGHLSGKWVSDSGGGLLRKAWALRKRPGGGWSGSPGGSWRDG